MQIDFKEIVRDRKSFLKNKIDQLEDSIDNLNISKPVEFSTSEIQSDYNPRKKGKKVGIEQLNFLENIKKPVVYIFEIIEENKIEIVKKEFKEHRSKRKNIPDRKEKRALSYLPADIEHNESQVLYVGSMKKDFHRRIKEHLGLGNYQTGAMNLKFWIPEDLKLNLYYLIVENQKLTYDIEAAVAKKLKPLIGKCEK